MTSAEPDQTARGLRCRLIWIYTSDKDFRFFLIDPNFQILERLTLFFIILSAVFYLLQSAD